METGAATHYELLRVKRGTQPEGVRAAYRRLAQKYHPDKLPGNAEAERVMAALNEAYAVLSDPERRARYDRRFEPAAPRSRPMPLILDDMAARDKAWPWYLLFATLSFTAATVGIAVYKGFFPGG